MEALPVGFTVEAVKVTEVIENQGIYVDVGIDGVRGFVHVTLVLALLTKDLSSIRRQSGFPTPQRRSFQSIFCSSRTDHGIQPGG